MGTEDDEFDEIVRGLDLNLSFPRDSDDSPDPEDVPDDDVPDEDVLNDKAADADSPASEDDRMLPGDDVSYRYPKPPRARQWSLAQLLAVAGIIGGPLLLIIATVSGVILPRPIAYGLAIIFVACAVWLIAQLPERGRGRPDSPDDGVEL